MKRTSSIEALLRKANADFANLRAAYDSSLQEKHVRDDFKVAIKNIFENLRSCLDYLAQDIFDAHCPLVKKSDRLYFPIRATPDEFKQVIEKDFPNLQSTAKDVFDIIESVQPYRNDWLGNFNKLNNHNKHQDLVEQTRTETKQVTVSREGKSISWTGVTFSPGISVLGVPIDPRTQMPIPNTVAETKVTIWIDFRFKEINQSVIPFVQTSLQNVEKMFHNLQPYI